MSFSTLFGTAELSHSFVSQFGKCYYKQTKKNLKQIFKKMSHENIWSGNCPFGEISVGKLSIWEMSVGELSNRGTVQIQTKTYMKIEFQNLISRWSFFCCITDIKIAWINPCSVMASR